MVREMGLKRREPAWILSAVKNKILIKLTLVREDRGRLIYGILIVFKALLVS
jgi:hypothetical protein